MPKNPFSAARRATEENANNSDLVIKGEDLGTLRKQGAEIILDSETEDPEKIPVDEKRFGSTKEISTTEKFEKASEESNHSDVTDYPPVRTTVLVPAREELALSLLKEKINRARRKAKQKGMVTKENLILDGLRLLFAQPGIYQRCLEAAERELNPDDEQEALTYGETF